MRFALLLGAIILFPCAAFAVEAPQGQAVIDAHKVLRGNFVEEHQADPTKEPMQTLGHFVLAPAYGLIWGMERPLPTSTVITPDGAKQVFGNVAMKLPAKNLRHIYDMVSGALAGNWHALESDFVVTKSGSATQWQMLLQPRNDKPNGLAYRAISVSGGRFVENIVMTKANGAADSFAFSGSVLASTPLTAAENALFAAGSNARLAQ